MTDPADKEDVKVLVVKLDKLATSMEGIREQNSQEHGSLFIKMTYLTTLMSWLRDAWKRFSIMPPPPDDPPRDDTQ